MEQNDLLFKLRNDACFTGEEFHDLKLEAVVMVGADFSGISLSNCVFSECDFSYAIFDAASLENVIFSNCDLEGAKFESIGGNRLMLSGCDLDNASFSSADVEDFHMSLCHGLVDFNCSSLIEAYFFDCKLRGSDFRGANISSATLDHCDLTGILIDEEADIRAAAISNSNITETSFSLAEGILDATFIDVIVMPFLEDPVVYGNRFDIDTTPRKVSLGKTSLEYTKLNVYKNIDFSAHLLCGDLTEYRNAR